VDKLARFMTGLWVFFATIVLLELVRYAFPDAATRNNIALGFFMVFSCLTTAAIWELGE